MRSFTETPKIMDIKHRPTIKDIAQKLNIHHSTVSRALRNHPDVKEETKKLILETAEEMNYQPDIFARNLKQNTTNIIGVIVPEIKHHFFSAVISGIEDVAYSKGYVIMVCQSNEQYDREVLNARALLSNKVAGLLVSISQTTHNCDHFKIYKDRGIPLVFFDRVCREFDAALVVVDDYRGAYEAVTHLIKSGRKHIYHIGGTEQLEISRKRYEGYVAALEDNGLSVKNQKVVWKGLQEEDGVAGMRELLADNNNLPDAVFAVNDPVALGAYEVLRSQGMKIPDDVSVVGFSNNPISQFVNPALTTVEQPSFEMGKTAAELLIKQILKEDGQHEIVLPTKLIIRSSS